MGDMVDMANRLCDGHQAADPAYPHAGAARSRRRCLFRAAQARLRLKPETELCLGLVHYTDGVAGDATAGGRRTICISLFGGRQPFACAGDTIGVMHKAEAQSFPA